jgi:hypothetical protein
MSDRPHPGPRLVAISRSPAYSPLQHGANDQAILDAVLDELATLGWSARRLTEHDAVSAPLPPASLYLNMCQGPAASEALREHETLGRRFFNRPSSVLGCHRHRLIPLLTRAGIPMPATVFLPTDEPITLRSRDALRRFAPGPLWLKRGGVHAERPEDVVTMEAGQLERGLARFAGRGIMLAAAQEHLPGPVIKFYGVAGGSFFHAYESETREPVTDLLVDGEALRALALRAAAALKLDIFGGDVVVTQRRRPMLIDLNDWPSFAPVRAEAARAIAGHVHAARRRGALV